MKHVLHLTALFCLFLQVARGQVDCSNVGFEQGNSHGWVLTYGTVTDANQQTVFQSEQNGTQNNEHYVTSISDGNDPKIPSIPMVAPGSTHSIRIGNVNEGGHFSRIHTEYTVTADNTLFQYKFAIVLQNTGADGRASHEPYQKPGFNILIFDSNGEELPCSSYDIQLEGTNTVEGFQASGDIQYRNWTVGAIDLRNFVGKKLTIVVTAHGCTRMRHFGYAYFDAECLKSEIKQVADCPDTDGYITLAAPEGFGRYSWNNGETSQQIRVKANVGDKFHVDMVPRGSLDESCALGLDFAVTFKKKTATLTQAICNGDVFVLGDTLLRTSGVYVRNVSKSNVCDSTVTLTLTVNSVGRFTQNLRICEGESVKVGDSTYTESGIYVQNIPQATGCDSLVTTVLEVIRLDVSLTPTFSMTQGDSVHMEPIVEPVGSYAYHWDQHGLSCTDCSDPWASPLQSTLYHLEVSDTDKVCTREAWVQVYVKPCGIDIPDAFSPNNDQLNEVFYVYGNACVKQVREMFIYNRWGEVVYQKSNFAASDPSAGWDGSYHGQKTSPGIYPYKIKVELTNGAFLNYKGVVNLLR
ncbi:MAG TPA: gliding motility-associated C-terminal domain-containing protein [Dyadobacter sp.]|nr:gliding motility-associated C-terminal domain-containing protein [Dyadobacter sp.]